MPDKGDIRWMYDICLLPGMSPKSDIGDKMDKLGRIVLYYDKKYGMPQIGGYLEDWANPADRTFIPNDEFGMVVDELGTSGMSDNVGFVGPFPHVMTN